MKKNELIDAIRVLRIDMFNNDNTLYSVLFKNPPKEVKRRAVKKWKKNRRKLNFELFKLRVKSLFI